jgi:hypothetical protein
MHLVPYLTSVLRSGCNGNIMSRTAKKANTNKTSEANANLVVSARMGRAVNKPDRDSKSERSFQTSIERMQLAIASGRFDQPKIVKRGQDALKRYNDTFQKLNDQLKKNGKGEKPVSEYMTLKGLYERDLAHLTIETFVTQAELSAARMIAKSRAEKLTDAQKEVIITFYDAQAHAAFNIVSEIRDLLESRGAIKSTKKESAKVENLEVTEEGVKENL